MPVKIFCCYAHEDELLLNKLKTHLKPLQRKGLIDVWYDRDISAGMKWNEEIDKHLNEANIVLLLISPDFMDSDYCYGIEMQQALERNKRGEARVIPIILRPVYWQDVLGTLQALPIDAKPVMSSSWQYQDEAFFNVTEGIRKIVVQLTSPPVFVSPAVQNEKQQEMNPERVPTTAVQQGGNVSPFLSPLAVENLTLLCTLTGHTALVYGVAFSSDGQTLVSGSADTTIKVWNLSTGKERRTLTGHTAFVYSVAFSADGQTLASGSADTTVKLWNPHTGELLRTLTEYSRGVMSVAFSPDGQTLASGSDNTIKLWGKK